MKKIKQSLLDSFKGKDPEKVKVKGWDVVPVKYGHAVSLMLVRDRVYLWLSEEGKVSKATSCDKDQVI